jgi:hypothetical protein
VTITTRNAQAGLTVLAGERSDPLLSPGPVDGRWGERTHAALRRYVLIRGFPGVDSHLVMSAFASTPSGQAWIPLQSAPHRDELILKSTRYVAPRSSSSSSSSTSTSSLIGASEWGAADDAWVNDLASSPSAVVRHESAHAAAVASLPKSSASESFAMPIALLGLLIAALSMD